MRLLFIQKKPIFLIAVGKAVDKPGIVIDPMFVHGRFEFTGFIYTADCQKSEKQGKDQYNSTHINS